MNAAAVPDAAPSADWTIDQGWERYTAREHAVWTALFERQTRLLPGRACDEFVRGMQALPLDAHQIPDFRRLSEILMKRTGWQIVAVPGLVPDEVFFDHLANRRFPSGNLIRSAHQLDYLQEPDVFHDVFGHVPLLMHPVMADYMQAYGEGGLRAKKLGELDKLSRVYWYTVEFGLLKQRDELRIYGAGIASSFTETRFSLESASPNRLKFDVERVMRTTYRIDDFQETYFVIDDIDELLQLAHVDFGALYQRVRGRAELESGDVVEGEGILTRGTGAYHRTAIKGA